jgi:hypothetical protein
MRIRTTRLILLIFAAAVLLQAAAPAQGGELKLKLFGGYGYMSGGDLNAGTEGLFDFWGDMALALGATRTGEFKPSHFGITFGGDVIFMFTPAVGIGFGSEYLRASKDSQAVYTIGSEELTISAAPTASAVPLKASLYLCVPAGAGVRMVLHAGAGYYLARMSNSVTLAEAPDTIEYRNEADANGIGFHGGLGFEVDFSANAGFFIEARGRYVKFDGFAGDFTFSTNGTPIATESGTLYYSENQGILSQFYPIILVSDTEPMASATVRNVRQAKIDFSGGSAVAGFFIRF